MFRRLFSEQTPQDEFKKQFSKTLNVWRLDLQNEIKTTKTISLELLEKYFHPIVKDYENIIKDKSSSQNMTLLKIEMYRDQFICKFFDIYIKNFSTKLSLLSQLIGQQKEYLKVDLKKIFEKNNINALPEKINKTLEDFYQQLNPRFADLLKDQKNINAEMEVAKGKYQFILPEDEDIEEEKQYKTLKDQLDILQNFNISKMKDEAAQFVLQELANYKEFEYKKILEEIILEEKENIKKISQFKDSQWHEERIKSAKERLTAKIVELKSDLGEFQKIFPKLPHDGIQRLFASFTPPETVIASDNDILVTLNPGTYDILILPDSQLMSNSEKTFWNKLFIENNLSLNDDSKDDANNTLQPENPKKKSKHKSSHRKKIIRKNKNDVEIPQMAKLLKSMDEFSKKVETQRTSLKDIIQNDKSLPDFAAFLENQMFQEMAAEHASIIKEREAIQENPDQDLTKDFFSTPAFLLPAKINHFPSFEFFQATLVPSFFEGYAKWFDEPIKHFKDISLYKKNILKAFEDKKSWADVRQSLDARRMKINKAMEKSFSQYLEKHNKFQKDLRAAEEKYHFHLTMDTYESLDFADLKQRRMQLDDFILEQIKNYKVNEYQNRLQACVDDLAVNFENLKTIGYSDDFKELQTTGYSFDKLCVIERDRLKIIQTMDDKSQKKMNDEFQWILKDIVELEKSYPGLRIPKPVKPVNNFQLMKEQWDASLKEHWKKIFTVDMLQAKKYFPDQDEYMEQWLPKFKGLPNQQEIASILDETVYDPNHNIFWDKLDPSNTLLLDHADEKAKSSDEFIQELDRFEKFRLGKPPRPNSSPLILKATLPEDMRDDPEALFRHMNAQERQRIEESIAQRNIEDPSQFFKKLNPDLEVKCKVSPCHQRKLGEELPVVEKPVEPELNLCFVSIGFLTLGVGTILYCAYYLYQCYQYQKQLIKYDDYLQRQDFRSQLNTSLEKEKAEIRAPIHPASGLGNKTDEQLKESWDHRNKRRELQTQHKQSRKKSSPWVAVQKPTFDPCLLLLSSFTGIGFFLYLFHYAYEYSKYKKISKEYQDKCRFWAPKDPTEFSATEPRLSGSEDFGSATEPRPSGSGAFGSATEPRPLGSGAFGRGRSQSSAS